MGPLQNLNSFISAIGSIVVGLILISLWKKEKDRLYIRDYAYNSFFAFGTAVLFNVYASAVPTDWYAEVVIYPLALCVAFDNYYLMTTGLRISKIVPNKWFSFIYILFFFLIGAIPPFPYNMNAVLATAVVTTQILAVFMTRRLWHRGNPVRWLGLTIAATSLADVSIAIFGSDAIPIQNQINLFLRSLIGSGMLFAQMERANMKKMDVEIALGYRETHDKLTGLPNRRELFDHLAALVAVEKKSQITLILVNINRFRLFSQGGDYSMGDHVLLAVASKLNSIARADGKVAKLGGDEFAILIEDETAVTRISRELRAINESPIIAKGHEYYINVSMGLSTSFAYKNDPDSMLRAAQAAVIQAKKTPGTTLITAEPRFEESLSRKLEHEQSIRNAILDNEFVLYYQPKVDATTRELISFEALARWNRAGSSFVSPIEFINVAERIAMINCLGGKLLELACRQMYLWRRDFGFCVPVAVNISPYQLMDANFVEIIRGLIADHELPPEMLTLEITESSAINDLEKTGEQLRDLDSIGVKVAMDDFGTGFSSLGVLRELPLNTIKIDRSLIEPLPEESAVAVVTAICQLAQALNMKVVAEGVESEAHAISAQMAGCHELQGYLFSKPLPSEIATTWLRNKQLSSIVG